MAIFKSDSATNNVISVTTTSTPVLTADDDRQFAVFCNDGTTPIYLGLGAAAEIGKGIRLDVAGNGNSRWEIDMNNLYIGTVYAIATPTTTMTICYK